MDIYEEDELIRFIQSIVDDACNQIGRHGITCAEAEEIINVTRSEVLKIAPADGETFDLIYKSRLRRIAEQFGGVTFKD